MISAYPDSRGTCVRVDLHAIAHNVRAIRRELGEQVQLMAVVKANAYGHGLIPVAQTTLQNGASCLAVAMPEEGRRLREAGVRVLLQTIPPFNYPEGLRERWLTVNDWIRSTLAGEADALFDVVSVLSESPERPYMARYGGHPDGTGCAAWAAALKPALSALIDRTAASDR